jgi:Phage major capsid protein E
MTTMDMNIQYTTIELINVVPNLKLAQTFLLDTFFRRQVMSDTEFVAIDIDVGIRRMAPFVSPLVEGKLVEQRRIQTNTYKPPYIKDKRAPDLRKPVRRMIGETIGGGFTSMERWQANLFFEMSDQIDVLTRRMEWMASQVLQNGTLTIAGEGFPTVLMDFGRDPTLSIALTGTAQWTPANVLAGNASPTSNIEAWQRNILKKSGAMVTDIVFTTSAWLGFIADPVLKGSAIYPMLGLTENRIDVGAQIQRGAQRKGRWGSYDLWVYNDWYVSDGLDGMTENTEYPILPDGSIIMSGPMMDGIRAFGVIYDPYFNYAGLPFAPKTWIAEDPPQQFLLMQSSPLIIPSRPNASASGTVCPAQFN